jgi:hypothetical protein
MTPSAAVKARFHRSRDLENEFQFQLQGYAADGNSVNV